MKKIILTKTTTVVTKPVDSTTLLDRKSMIENYKKLFEALFDLPDKKVVARVLDAINNAEKRSPNIEVIEVCSKCNQKTPKIALVDASTQTEGEIIMHNSSAGNSDDSRDASTPATSTTFKPLNAAKQPINASTTDINKVPLKRRRHRKAKIPHVIKKSQAQAQQQHNKPILQKRKAAVLKTNENDEKECNTNLPIEKRQRHDSVSSATSNISNLFEESTFQLLLSKEDIIRIMEREYMKAEQREEDGLLPIHSAIVEGDSTYLERQILVWRYLKHEDLNELLTDDDEDCLQLAVVEKSSTEILKILLSNGLNVDCQDANSNTIIHLAILNEVSTDVLQVLMDKIDLKSLFILNFDGFTPLHLAVRQNQYMLAETFLDNFDKRLLGKIYHDREKVQTEKSFLKYYENHCERFELKEYMRRYSKEQLLKKRKLMDIGDICSGNTVLHYAVENKLEHLIYFLLAHFADPQVESLSGQSPASFMNEFAKSLNLSLKINQVMENVVSLLNK